MKIIIIDHEPYSARRAKHYYINDFKEEGAKVEYWCVWKVFDYCKKLNYSYQDKETGVRYFYDLENLLLEINYEDSNNTFLFIDLRFQPDTSILFQRIKEKKNLNGGDYLIIITQSKVIYMA